VCVFVCGGREGTEIGEKRRGEGRDSIQLLQHLNQHSLLDSGKYGRKRERIKRRERERVCVCVFEEGGREGREIWEK
jgi:hypothetical protein